MRAAVFHTIHAGGSIHRTAKLIIDELPERTPAATIMDALTKAGRAGAFTEAGVPFGNHEIKTETAKGWPAKATGTDTAPHITWTELSDPRNIPERRITIRVPQPIYDTATAAAARTGRSLNAWLIDAITTHAAN